MRTEKIEKKLAEEVRGETPDVLDSILARCGETPQKAAPVPISAARGRKWVKAMYAAAAMLLLFVGGYFGIGQYRQAYAAEYTVTLDAGASVQLEVSKTGRVVSASGLDEKGRAAVEAAQSGRKLKGRKLGAAVESVVSAMAENGAVANAGTVLVSVSGPDAGENAAVKTQVTATVQKALAARSIRAAVLGQIVEQSEKLDTLAETYGVSAGRAALIEQAAENEPGLGRSALAELDVGALAVLGTDKSDADSASTGVSAAVGTENAGGYVSADAAAQSACAKAGASLGSAAKADVSASVSDGKLVYKVRVATPAGSAVCEVDARTGQIFNWVSDVVSAAVGGTGSASGTTSAQASASPDTQTGGGSTATPAPSAEAGVSVSVGVDAGSGQSVLDKVHDDVQDALDKAKQDLESKLSEK